jgi:hypothetical protein
VSIWKNMMDKIARRPTDAEVRRMEPKGADEARYVQQERDALRYRSRHNDRIERDADLGPEIAADRAEAREAARAKASPARTTQRQAPSQALGRSLRP